MSPTSLSIWSSRPMMMMSERSMTPMSLRRNAVNNMSRATPRSTGSSLCNVIFLVRSAVRLTGMTTLPVVAATKSSVSSTLTSSKAKMTCPEGTGRFEGQRTVSGSASASPVTTTRSSIGGAMSSATSSSETACSSPSASTISSTASSKTSTSSSCGAGGGAVGMTCGAGSAEGRS